MSEADLVFYNSACIDSDGGYYVHYFVEVSDTCFMLCSRKKKTERVFS